MDRIVNQRRAFARLRQRWAPPPTDPRMARLADLTFAADCADFLIAFAARNKALVAEVGLDTEVLDNLAAIIETELED